MSKACEGNVLVRVIEGLLTKQPTKHSVIAITADGKLTVAEACMLAIGVPMRPSPAAGVTEHMAVVLNGERLTRENDPRLTRPLHADDQLSVFPAPKDLGPGFFILLAISLASSIASYVLAPKLGPGDQPSDGDRRFGFDRVSRPAVRGEPIPVILGEKIGYAPVRVAAIPGEGADGNSTLRVLYVIAGHRCGRIGTRDSELSGGGVADADDLRPGRSGGNTIAGITLNDQPIENFPDARVSVRFGRSGQRPIPGFRDTEIVRDVGSGGTGTLLANTSGSDRGDSDWTEAVTYSTVDPAGVDALTLRFRFPQGLYALSDGGGYLEGRVLIRWQWRVRDVGGGTPGAWSATQSTDIRRIEQSPFVAAARVDKPLGGGGGWHASTGTGPAALDVRVQRVTRESDSASIAEDARFIEVIESRVDDNRYVDCALLAITLTAGEQLTSEPRVRVDVRGYDDCRIWDGVSSPSSPVWTRGWTNNPAWLLLAVLTDAKLRAAGTVQGDASIDLPALIAAGSRSDDLVLRQGSGSARRRRHTCNLVLIDSKPVQDVVRDIARTMWSIVQVSDKIRVLQDRPRTAPSDTFTDGSIAVSEGYSRLATTYTPSRGGTLSPNQVRVQFDNAALAVDGGDLAGGTDLITFPEAGDLWLGGEDAEPVNPVTVKLEGVTDPDEAADWAVYDMKSRRARDRQTVLEAASPIVNCQPLDRIDVASSVCGWGVASGRLMAGSTTSAVVLDRELVIEPDRSYTIDVIHDDDAIERSVLGLAPGVYVAGSVLPLEIVLSQSPADDGSAQYSVGYVGTGLVPRLVTEVRRAEGGGGGGGGESAGGLWQITCVPYDAAVYDATPADVEAVNVSTLGGDRRAPGPVTELRIASRLASGVANGASVVTLSWRQEPIDRQRTGSFRVYRRAVGGTFWQLVPGITAGLTGVDLTIADADIAFEFRVVAVSVLGSALSVNDDRHPTVSLVLGLGEAPPASPASATLTQGSGNLATLSWAAVAGASGYQILYGGSTGTGLPNDGAEDCLVLARVSGGTSTTLGGLVLPAGVSTRYWVRAVGGGGGGGAAGRLSLTAATVVLASPAAPTGESVKHTFVADLSAGTRGNATHSGGKISITDVEASGGEGSWTSAAVDTGSVTLTRLAIAIATENGAIDPTIAEISAPSDAMKLPSIEADQWGVASGSGASAVVGMLMPAFPDDAATWTTEVRTSSDGSSYTDWSVLSHGASIVASMRYYQVRCRLKVRDAARAYRPVLAGVTVVGTH